MNKAFSSLDSLGLALNFAKDSAKGFFLPDFFRHQDFIHSSGLLLNDISIKLKHKEYKPHQILSLDIPKTGLTTRPGSLIEFSDFVVLFSIVCSFAKDLDSRLPDNVFSCRFNSNYKAPDEPLFADKNVLLLPKDKRKKLKFFEQWYEAWPAFELATEEIIDSEQYKYLVISDISAYYENINHDVLRNLLLTECPRHVYEVNLLMEALRNWTTSLPDGYKIGRGIPQGNTISSFLGNVYLLSLDRMLMKFESTNEIKFIRYMDDVKIFAKSHGIAKKVLFEMNSVLRELQLNIQGAKTDIYERDEFIQFISDERLNNLNKLVEDILENANEKNFGRLRSRYLEELKKFSTTLGRGRLSKEKIRFFKRLLTGFTHISRPDMVSKCFRVLDDTPVLTDKIVQYFKRFVGGKRIPIKVFNMIQSGELFEYQVARLIEIFWHKREIPEGFIEFIYKNASNRELNWAVRLNSLIALSFFDVDVEKRKSIARLLRGEINFKVKKAIVLCLLQAPRNVKEKILEECFCDTDYRVSLFAKYLKDMMSDKKTQQYEIANLERLESRLFIEESYKLLLLRDSEDVGMLKALRKVLAQKTLEKAQFPIHTRLRISWTYQEVKKNIKLRQSNADKK